MYNIRIQNIDNKYDYSELIKIFLPPNRFRAFTETEYQLAEDVMSDEDTLIVFNEANFGHKDYIKREIFQGLSQITGRRPAWGILTGVRPVKLTGELFKLLGTEDKVREKLTQFYFLSDEKAQLLLDTYGYQQKMLGPSPNNHVCLYIGIPFCPTRCLYCSFTSNQKGDDEIQRYLDALLKEVRYCGQKMGEKGLCAESIYIGGGTPTTLSANQLDLLISQVKESFDLSALKEFTVEAGRPDTITAEKIKVLSDHGIGRISINPQSMKAKTLELIGRSHSPEEIEEAFALASEAKIDIVNADIIAGLPEESPEDFAYTLDKIIKMGANNITVHTLAVKRASKLIDLDPDYHYKQGQIVSEMLDISKSMLKAAGYRPYYLYRQKHMAGAFENVGYCKDDTPCVYNIRIMEEQQSNIALGAGAISKVYFPEENRLERVPNVSNYEIYIERLEEMLQRKENNLF